jgi:hypothetical protein
MDLSLTVVDRLSLTVDTFSCLSKIRGVAPLLFTQADGSKTIKPCTTLVAGIKSYTLLSNYIRRTALYKASENFDMRKRCQKLNK